MVLHRRKQALYRAFVLAEPQSAAWLTEARTEVLAVKYLLGPGEYNVYPEERKFIHDCWSAYWDPLQKASIQKCLNAR